MCWRGRLLDAASGRPADEAETIDRIVCAAIAHNKTTYRQASTYGRRLINLNKQALRSRYGEKVSRTDYAYRTPRHDSVQTYKSIQCFLYQCTEGDVPSSDLFKEIEALGLFVGVEIGDVDEQSGFAIKPHLKATYEAADWG